MKVEEFKTTPEKAKYVIRFEASGVAGGPRRIWRCEKGWSEVRSLSMKLRNIKDIDRANRWARRLPGVALAIKTTVPRKNGVWDEKRLQGRKKEMQVFLNKFVKWANETYSNSNYDVFNSKTLQDFLRGSEVN